MFNRPQTRITAVLLALCTLAACVLAFINYRQESSYELPSDGVLWSEASSGTPALVARQVLSNSPGARAGIKEDDLLISVDDRPADRISSLTRAMAHTGIYGRATYSLIRSGVHLDVPVILEPADRGINLGLRFIALVYLLIGLYVLLRRWTAPQSTHFYLFCLTSFVFYAFIYTGKFNTFDWIIYWGYIFAGALQPALFLHFALTFTADSVPSEALDPAHPPRRASRRLIIGLCYLPGVIVLGLQISAIQLWSATELLKHRLDQLALGYLAAYYVLAAIVFFVSYRRTRVPLLRQQLKWLTRGTLLAVTPFTLLYVIPFLSDLPSIPLLTRIAVLSLVFLPLTFSYAIVRYRLMDVDLIFKRGVTYTLATAALAGLYFGLIAFTAEVVHTRLPAAGGWGLLAAIVIFALIFDPMKRAIQDRVDRIFDRKRYDYRTTLIEFGRGLSSQTDLDTLLAAIVDRLPQTLLVARVAVFLATGDGRRFSLAAAHGFPPQLAEFTPNLDLGFFDFDDLGAGSHIFLENAQQALHLPEGQRRSASMLDLNYYLPCRISPGPNRAPLNSSSPARSSTRTIAVIGLGRTTGGDFLSSEDVELLETLASYIGIAIQNARLYASLEDKMAEYERLKEFNENIVESINIGILAVDLEDRVDSWNTQMEVMYAAPRADAVGKPLDTLFPPDFISEYQRVKDSPGIHNLYKFRLATRAGEIRTANIAIAPLVSRNFETVGRIILVDDITGRIELETQLAQAEKLSSIGLLAAGVAHEVNTPLAVISSYTQMLAKQLRSLPAGPAAGSDGSIDRISPLLEKITQQTFRASEIVNGLLNFSRTSAVEFRQVDLNQVLRETVILLEHQFKTARITVDLALEPGLPGILGNTGKLQQVFLNLFLNAKDAMSGGGTLNIATRSGGHVGVFISDTGSGIAPEHLRRIYDPFFTTKSAPREGERRGTGLGLAVTYGIIQEHAGKIEVTSDVGTGTTFRLEFPTLRNPARKPAVASPSQPPATADTPALQDRSAASPAAPATGEDPVAAADTLRNTTHA